MRSYVGTYNHCCHHPHNTIINISILTELLLLCIIKGYFFTSTCSICHLVFVGWQQCWLQIDMVHVFWPLHKLGFLHKATFWRIFLEYYGEHGIFLLTICLYLCDYGGAWQSVLDYLLDIICCLCQNLGIIWCANLVLLYSIWHQYLFVWLCVH
jgi:hypothetical protein